MYGPEPHTVPPVVDPVIWRGGKVGQSSVIVTAEAAAATAMALLLWHWQNKHDRAQGCRPEIGGVGHTLAAVLGGVSTHAGDRI